jgi:hypothetical protein
LIEFLYAEADLVAALAMVSRTEVRIMDYGYSFKLKSTDSQREFPLHSRKIQTLFASIQGKSLSDETGLYDETSFEIMVKEESPLNFRRDNAIRVSDSESNIAYEVTACSDEYLLWIIATSLSKVPMRDLGFIKLSTSMAVDRISDNPDPDIFDFLRAIFSRLETLKLRSSVKLPFRRFQSATNAFLFHIAYNLDVAYAPQRFIEEILRRGRISRVRRSTPADLDPPRRLYNEDLVNHYILAVSTDSPTVQFLSYYHVLEHFFESVFNDELLEQIKSSITQPGFSYKRKKDVAQLVATIKKSLQIKSETITFSESEALRLSLTKFVDVPSLINRLDEYDPKLIDYYSNDEVPFSNGAKIAFRSGEIERIVREMGRRIYSTRNSLVHSKDGDKARYTPFKDERALLMEVPLMRFVSELVILSVSEVL